MESKVETPKCLSFEVHPRGAVESTIPRGWKGCTRIHLVPMFGAPFWLRDRRQEHRERIDVAVTRREKVSGRS